MKRGRAEKEKKRAAGFQWVKQGKCSRGETCGFKHDDDKKGNERGRSRTRAKSSERTKDKDKDKD